MQRFTETLKQNVLSAPALHPAFVWVLEEAEMFLLLDTSSINTKAMKID
jgi:hypothetical protein